MEYIAHRINTIKELKSVPTKYGIEVDLRDYNGELVLQHDPFKTGENFEEFLKNFNHGTIILNIKSERIEIMTLKLLKKYNIKNYFFLDSSFPMIYSLIKNGEKNIAIRFSEFEGIDTVLNMKGMIKWVWVDCFNKLPITKKLYLNLKKNGFNLCLVSPDLQNQSDKIENYKEFLKENSIIFDSICTKKFNIKRWENY